MKTATYHLLDVFTDTRFAGNQLAVFLDADALESATCQAIARELNLAETVFLSRADAPNRYPMRIFTPVEELDFAGHPTVGTAWLLADLGLVDRGQSLTLVPPVGALPIAFDADRASFITAHPARVEPSALDGPAAAALLGLEVHQVIGSPVISSCGLAFHLIELRDLATLAAVSLSAAEWKARVAPTGVEQVYLYVADTPTRLRTRMFSREHGVCEDAATGSAAAALSGYLATTGTARRWTLHQGVEMGRPSVIDTAMEADRIRVGGRAVWVGKGELRIG